MNNRAKIALLILAALAVAWFFWPSGSNWPITNEQPSDGPIIAFGDSITRGFGVGEGDNYPSKLSARIGKPVLNAGANGHTTADGLARLQRDVLSHKPAIVIVCLGGNDMLRRQPAGQQFDNLRAIITQIQQSGALVILLGVEGDGLLYGGDYDEYYEQLARETGAVYVPDILDGIIGRANLMVDNIHPNAAGYDKVVEKILSRAGKYLE